MGAFSVWHWLIVLAVVLLIFGTKRIRNVGQDVGESLKGFRKALRDDEPQHPDTSATRETSDVPNEHPKP